MVKVIIVGQKLFFKVIIKILVFGMLIYFKSFKSKSFNGTNMINYGICYDLDVCENILPIINAFFSVRVPSNATFRLEKLSPQ